MTGRGSQANRQAVMAKELVVDRRAVPSVPMPVDLTELVAEVRRLLSAEDRSP